MSLLVPLGTRCGGAQARQSRQLPCTKLKKKKAKSCLRKKLAHWQAAHLCVVKHVAKGKHNSLQGVR